MTEQEVRQLAADGRWRRRPLRAEYVETHISWVLLSGRNAFKIKKPVRFSFADFSSLRKRRYFCRRELQLNRRYTHIYQDVAPVRWNGNTFSIGPGGGRIVDYAVVMRRLASARRMDRMLRQGIVTPGAIRSLAETVAHFHERAAPVDDGFDAGFYRENFKDILTVGPIIRKHAGQKYMRIIRNAIQWVEHILKVYAADFHERARAGYRRDLHGDLHSGNIFLYRKPILFDCIEFNDLFRYMDVLDEIALLSMDLQAYEAPSLADEFIGAYLGRFPCLLTSSDEIQFRFYQCYRANVRAKVLALASDAHEGGGRHEAVQDMLRYLRVIDDHIRAESW